MLDGTRSVIGIQTLLDGRCLGDERTESDGGDCEGQPTRGRRGSFHARRGEEGNDEDYGSAQIMRSLYDYT